MTSFALSPSTWSNLTALFTGSKHVEETQTCSKRSLEYRQAELDCVKDLIWDHPELFSSELDVQNAMYMYSGRF